MKIEIAPKSTEVFIDWASAVIYCKFLEVNGKNDWRLPTIDELNDIFRSENDFGSLVGNSVYWTNTEHDEYYAWAQSFWFFGGGQRESKDNVLGVRAVRSTN
jgi:hypothetical protein